MTQGIGAKQRRGGQKEKKMQKMEILYFGLSRNRGGIETYLYKIAQRLDKERYHLNFIDMTGDGIFPCFYHELKDVGCTFYKITPRNVSAIRNRKEIIALFSENHFDIFHFNVNTLSYLFPVISALKNGTKVLVHSRSTGPINTKSLTRILHELNKIKLKHMQVTRIAVSGKAGKWLFGDTPFEVYHNGVDTEKFVFSEKARIRIRRDLGCDNKAVIGHVGVFTFAKNHAFMVRVFKEYLKINPSACLWFIGDGALREKTQELVDKMDLKDSILFLGEQKDLRELYAGMDLFWFPSIYEGFGNVLLEAQCEGLPCLLSDCVPKDAVIADNVFTYSLNEPPEKWATKIEEAVQTQKTDRSICYKEMEAAGVSVKSEIARLQDLYETMLAD